MAGQRWADYEDAELVVETLVGHTSAFDMLVERYRPAVLATVMRHVASRAVAEEIGQEVFLRAFRGLRLLRDPFRFPAWLHAIARREVARFAPAEARAGGHEPLEECDVPGCGVEHPDPWEAVARRAEGDRVRRAMAALPRELHLVLTLRYWAEMPVEQIAAFIGRPVTTAKWRLHRARALMRKLLESGEELTAKSEPSPD